MKHRHIVEASIALLTLLSVGAIFNVIQLPSLTETTYTLVDATYLFGNPTLFESEKISTSVTIKSQYQENTTYHIYSTDEGFLVRCPSTLPELQPGDHVAIRGVSEIIAHNEVDVQQLEVIYPSVSIIRSVPGFILFLVLFFWMYRFDFRLMKFVRRHEQDS